MITVSKTFHSWFLVPEKEREPIQVDFDNLQKIAESNRFTSRRSFGYFSELCQAANQSLERLKLSKSLKIYVTWDVNHLPSYGDDVVAIILDDEFYRIPTYLYKTFAVFKCCGGAPIVGANLLDNPSYLSLLSLQKFLRIQLLRRSPGMAKFYTTKLIKKLSGKDRKPQIYPIPTGFCEQRDVDFKEFNKRDIDVFFDGSVEGKMSVYISPKKLSRFRMLSAIEKIKHEKHGQLNISLNLLSSFQESMDSDSNLYSENMMNSKVCLVPRGTHFETYRFFEAIRYGCIPITEAQPPRWFYDDGPAIRVSDWNRLDEVLLALFDDEQELERRHQESLRWWKDICSPHAVGNHIAQVLESLDS